MQELAEAGRPHGGGNRPFGFEADKVTVRAAEAEVITQLVARALAGESLTALCRWLAESGTSTVGGKEWRTPTLRGLLLNPRIYGYRSHNGEPIAPATWPAIISRQDGERLRVLLTDPARRTNRTARRYLLSGLCRCHACGNKMFSVPNRQTRRYLCRSGHDFGGCGRLAVSAAPLEALVRDAVLIRLDGPALADALADRSRDEQEGSLLSHSIAEATAQLEELAHLYAARKLPAPEWLIARKDIEARREDDRRALARLSNSHAIDQHIGHGVALRQQWDQLGLTRQVAIVRAVVDHVQIGPGRRGARSLDLERVRIFWRL